MLGIWGKNRDLSPEPPKSLCDVRQFAVMRAIPAAFQASENGGLTLF